MLKKYLLLFVLLFTVPNIYAQYNITSDASANVEQSYTDIDVDLSSRVAVVSMAEKDYLKKLRLNERNFFETKNAILFNQYSFTNWAEGGENSFNGKASTFTRHIYDHGNINVSSYINAAYGLSRQDGSTIKTDDFFEVNSTISNRIWGAWYYSLGFNLKSQFSKTFEGDDQDIYVSSFFAPATFNLFAGITYKLSDKRTVMLSPLSLNNIFVLDPSLTDVEGGAFGVDQGETINTRLGILLNIQWEEPITKDGNLTYTTVMQSFWNYSDVPNFSWENWLNYEVMKYFTVGVYFKLVYDDTIGNLPNDNSFWQIKQNLGFGIAYNFANKKKK